MKPALILLFSLLSFSSVSAQIYQWTRVSGDITGNQPGVYGIKGIASSANRPGARGSAAGWTDTSGNLWLFGGYVYTTRGNTDLNDLWKYVPSANQWTWISGDSIYQPGVYGTKGIAASTNLPAARNEAVTWTDASGNLWLFGGRTYGGLNRGSAVYNDLWRYTPSTGWWTWMSGDSIGNQKGVYGTRRIPSSTNKPGVKAGAVGWTDTSGNLWLFGGDGVFGTNTYTEFNDLWMYDPSSEQWTWVSGDSTSNQPGVYGTKGTANSFTKPGARKRAVHWTDASGNLLLFGGDGYATTISPQGYLNDLWKYSPSTGWWTWMSGDSLAGQTGTYGIQGTEAAPNKPGARNAAVSWTDLSGNLLLFGGYGYVSGSGPFVYYSGSLNDFWKYSPSTGRWTWMSGSNSVNQGGSLSTPGSRAGAVAWTVPSGNLWMFGGSGLSDLWKYSVATTPLPIQFSSFTAQKQQQAVLLNWITAQEQNSRYFIIERSPDAMVYDSIDKVTAMNRVSSSINYSFIDKDPLQGTNFYRLKQVDQDGRFLYSAIAKIIIKEDAAHFTVVQNPVQNTMQLSVQLPSARKLIMQVRNISGHLLLSKEDMGRKGSSVHFLSIGHLASGAYLINVQMGNVNSTKSFIKQ